MTTDANSAVQLLQQYWWLPWLLNIVQWLLSGVVSSMDMPDATSGTAYRFTFKFLNWMLANPWRAKAASQPSLADQVIAQKTTTTKETVVSVPPADPEKDK